MAGSLWRGDWLGGNVECVKAVAELPFGLLRAGRIPKEELDGEGFDELFGVALG